MTLALRGAIVVDGTGSPWTDADVLVTDGVITEVGDIPKGAADEDIDLTGLVLAPGFIDPHTHYDAQVLWDRDLTPSSWHGVTTVVMGNCGFGIAPASPQGRELVMRTLENVEGMPLEALRAGIPWTFESFPEYLDALDAEPTRLQCRRALRPHARCASTSWVRRPPNAPPRRARSAGCATSLLEGMRAGAIGFSTSRSESHRGAFGRPVPSRLADLSEIWTLAGGMGATGKGTVEATWGPDFHVEECARLAADIGRPVTWAAIMVVRENAAMSVRISSAGSLPPAAPGRASSRRLPAAPSLPR